MHCNCVCSPLQIASGTVSRCSTSHAAAYVSGPPEVWGLETQEYATEVIYRSCVAKLLNYWIKIDHIDVTCFIISLFTARHVSNVSTSIFRSLRLIVDLFHVMYCSGSMCVGVTVWFGWGGYHTTPAEPHRNTNIQRTRAIQHMK